MKARVLVVDDDAAVRYTLRSILEDAGLEVVEAEQGRQALECLDTLDVHLILSDLRMPEMDGLTLLSELKRREHAPRLVLITAHGSERAAVEAMKLGAYDYFRKPFETDELLAVVERAVESIRLTADNERLEAELGLARSMVFVSDAMKDLALFVRRVAPKDVTVLIQGESGTGKERLAESIVRASARSTTPFVRFNCAAVTSELAEAELFGHAKGAFTGAHRSRRGLFREADGGTLFLDEIGELDPRIQAKLLRVLQEGEVRPLGEDRPAPIDVRILAATHRDLDELVTTGAFREDLLYRLRVVRLRVPPLRERPEDIVPIAEVFLRELGERFGIRPSPIPPRVAERLMHYGWPGNVRELRNAIESLVALSPPDGIDWDLLSVGNPESEPNATLEQRLAAFERGVLVRALEQAGGNRKQAAERLGIGRATLYEKLRKYAIEREP